jgi:hypothetical protein
MAKFIITIMREDDEFQGLTPLADIIENGLSCITTNVVREESGNSIDLIFEEDPEKIENTLTDFNPEDVG